MQPTEPEEDGEEPKVIEIRPASQQGSPDKDEPDASQGRPRKVFISYEHEDRELRKRLEKHLSPLIHEGKITIWKYEEIPAGANWKNQIDTHIDEADIILLLVSPNFIASEYCWGNEVSKALELHKAEKAHVIPILLKPIDWKNTPLGKLQALPAGARPVTEWPNKDTALNDVAQGIRSIVERRNPLQKFFEKVNANIRATFLKKREAERGQENGPLSKALFLVGCLVLLGSCLSVGLHFLNIPFPSWISLLALFLVLPCAVLLIVEAIRPHKPVHDGQRRAFLSLVAVTLGLFAGESIVQGMGTLSRLKIGLINNGDITQENLRPFENDLSGLLGGIPVPPSDIEPSYKDTIIALAQGDVEVGWLGPFSYLRANSIYNVRAILHTITAATLKDTYQSYIIVNPRSRYNIHSLADLKGTGKKLPFALADANSTSGRLMPLYDLKKAGVDLSADISTSYAGSHEQVIEKVLSGEFAAGGVASDVYANALGNGRFLENIDMLVIHKSREIPTGPFVVRSDIQYHDELRIEDALLTAADIDSGTIHTIGIGGFDKILHKDYTFLLDNAKEVGISPSDLD